MHKLEYETKSFVAGLNLVAGVDEVGRGPLAGPVLSACVAISKDQEIDEELLREVRDSKKISEKKREKLCALIFSNIKNVGVAMCDREKIDEINILQASLLSMKKAVENLSIKPEMIFVDGNNEIRGLNISQKTVIKGDSKVFCIAAASIVAKVTRDNMMKEYHRLYPEYGFDKHKGYGTKLHIEMLQIHGACPIHRRTFSPVAKVIA